LIYGGSVNEGNVDEVVSIDVLDGVGAGRTSLDAQRVSGHHRPGGGGPAPRPALCRGGAASAAAALPLQ